MPSTARRLALRWRQAVGDLPAPVRRAARRLRRSDGPAPAQAPAPADTGPARASDGANGSGQDVAPPPHRETLLRSLERGRSLDNAVLAQVRALMAAGEHGAAQSIAESLRGHDETRTLGHLTGGIVAFRRGFVELAWDELRRVDREAWARFAPAAYVRSGLAVAADDALREIAGLVADDPPAVRARSWFEILTAVYGYGAGELARELFAIFDRHVREDRPAWRQGAKHRDWMRSWVAADASSPTAPSPPDARPTFAIMDYGHPGANRASANIGDHLQSVAALSHLARHRGVRFHGAEDLVEMLTALGDRTRTEAQREDVDADLEVLTVHRDASMYEAIPAGTWVLCFGWYMHALFGMRHGFPLHRNLRPIFVSFHCNKRDLLTPEAVDYLKRYGPVGCRDWTTVYLLSSIGVPAFFSGCLTTTVSTLFPDLAAGPPKDAPIAYVDAPPGDVPAGGVTYRHSQPPIRRRSFVANVYTALDLLETYRREHSGVVTSRLHCYLPVRSIGVDVDFRPKNRSDVRFDGLVDIDDDAFDAIREGLLGKLEQVLPAILTGRPEAEVYGLWRAITAADVAAAEERRSRGIQIRPVAAGIEGQVGAVVSQTVDHRPTTDAEADDTVHCAVILRKGGGLGLSVLVASLLEHTSRPLHVWILALEGTGAAQQRVTDRFPQLTFSWVPARGLGADLRTPSGSRPDAAGVIRLLLADLLTGADRVVVLPVPSVATADVGELADLDLGGHAIAAPRRPGRVGASGFGVIHVAAARLGGMTHAAATLRRTAHARHRFDFDAFTHDVLVLDLERWRREGFGRRALALAAQFGLDDLEVLHYLVGPEHAAVPERWARVPTRSPERGAGLIHWADGVKPSHQELTPERDRWRRYASAIRARSGAATPR